MLRGRSVPSPVRFTSQKEWPYPPSSGAELAVSDCAVGLLLFDAMCFDALQAMHGGGGDGDAERAPATGGDQDGERAATSTSAIEKHLGFHSLLPFTSEVRFTREPRETTQRSSRRARQRSSRRAQRRPLSSHKSSSAGRVCDEPPGERGPPHRARPASTRAREARFFLPLSRRAVLTLPRHSRAAARARWPHLRARPQVGKYTHVAARLAERGHPDVVCLQEAKELSSYATAHEAAAAAASAAARTGGGGGRRGSIGVDDDTNTRAPEPMQSCFSRLAEVRRSSSFSFHFE